MAELKKSSLPETLAGIPANGDQQAILEFASGHLTSWSFDAVLETAGKLSAGLRQRGRGDASPKPVIVFAPASATAIVAALGVSRSGSVVVPLDTQMPDEDLARALENCDARLAPTTKRLRRRLKKLKDAPALECFLLDIDADDTNGEKDAADTDDEALSWRALLADSPGEAGEPERSDTAVLFYTSGTTGPPKGVPLSHANILFQLEAVVLTGLIRQDDRMLQPLPLHHVYPFVIGTLAPLALGLPVILPGALTGSALATALQEGEATVPLGVPRLYQAFYSGLRDRVAASSVGSGLFKVSLALAKAGNRIGLPAGRILFRPIRKKAAPRLRLLASGGSPLDPTLARNLEALGWLHRSDVPQPSGPRNKPPRPGSPHRRPRGTDLQSGDGRLRPAATTPLALDSRRPNRR